MDFVMSMKEVYRQGLCHVNVGGKHGLCHVNIGEGHGLCHVNAAGMHGIFMSM